MDIDVKTYYNHSPAGAGDHGEISHGSRNHGQRPWIFGGMTTPLFSCERNETVV